MLQRLADGFSLFAEDLEHVDDVLGDAREEFRGASAFITGGTGFFGIWLVESLLYLSQKHGLDLTVTVLTRSAESFRGGKGRHLAGRADVRLVEGDMATLAAPDGAFTHIVHLASESNVDNRPDWAGRHVRGVIAGTNEILDLAVRSKARGTLLTSSGAVYLGLERSDGPRSVEGAKDIGDVLSEKSAYGTAKRTMELLGAISAAEHDHRVLVARCFAFVGPYLPLEANYAIGNFIRDALAGRDIVVGGDGTPLRSYLYAADLAAQLLKLLAQGRSGVPYNVGGEEIVSIRQLAERVASVAGTGSKVTVMKQPVPGAPPNAYVPSIARIRDDLQLAPALGLDDSIARTIAWHRARAA